jgi:hypothetical protein
MPSWILGSIDPRSEIWKTYPVQRVVVEAPDEQEARRQVAEATSDALPGIQVSPPATRLRRPEALVLGSDSPRAIVRRLATNPGTP